MPVFIFIIFILLGFALPYGWANGNEVSYKNSPKLITISAVLQEGIIRHEVWVFSENKDFLKPPVLLLHELPGLSKETMEYAKSLAGDFTVYVPMLFGSLGQDSIVKGLMAYAFNGEWERRERLGGSRLITQWLRYLVPDIAKKHQENKIGIIGMCLTGSMPLALLDHKMVQALVIAQPSLPLWEGGEEDEESLDISRREWQIAQDRIGPKDGQVRVYALRFKNDQKANRKKHLRIRREFGSAGDGVFIDAEITMKEYQHRNNRGDLEEISENAHSTLIREWRNQKNHPSQKRRKEILYFLKDPMHFQRNGLSHKGCS